MNGIVATAEIDIDAPVDRVWSALVDPDQIEKYIDHWVVVFGAPKPTADGKDIVIHVESLQLK